MSTYLARIAAGSNRLVRASDFEAPRASAELQRLSKLGALARVAKGYYALVPEGFRDGTWLPTIEAVALGVAVADYGTDGAALIGPSAARVHGCYPRALTVATVAVPLQRPVRSTTSGDVYFVVRDVSKFDLVRANTELVSGWATSVEQTLLDLTINWPRWPISKSARLEMVELLKAKADLEVLHEVALTAPGGRASLERLDLEK